MKNNFSIYVEITLLAEIISAVLNINFSFLGNRFQFSYSWTFCSTTAGLDNCFREVNEVTIKTQSGANQTTGLRPAENKGLSLLLSRLWCDRILW